MRGDGLAQDGAVGAMIRELDWSTSPLGPPDAWSPGLWTTAGLMLRSAAQIVLFWGPEFAALYNDAYAPTIGGKHPRALGRPANESWAELWEDLGPLLAGVRDTGRTFTAKDRPFYIERHGFGETGYFDVSYSAVPEADGSVGGVLCIVSETTARVRAARRQAFLLALSDALRPLADPREIQATAARVIGRELGAERAFFATSEGDGAEDDDAAVDEAVARRSRIDDNDPDLVDALGKGRTVARPGIAAESGAAVAERAARASPRTGASLHVPCLRHGRLSGVLAVYAAASRAFAPEEIALAEEAAERAWAAVDRSRTAAALRDGEEQLRLATEAADVGLWDVDVANDRLFWPARVKAMFGVSPAAPVSMADFYGGLHPDDRKPVGAAFAAALDPDRRALYDVEYRTIGKEDGVVRWVAAKGRGLFDERGRCVRVIGTAIDVTARRAEAEAAEASRRLLDAVLDAMPVGVVIADAQGAITRTNPANALLWGGTPETRGVDEYRRWVGYWPDGRRIAAHEWAMARALEAGETCPGELVEIERFDGGRRFMLNSAAPVRNGAGDIVAGLVAQLDVTERVRAERALQALNDSLEAQVAERTAERDRVWRNSRDLMVVIGADGIFRAISPSWTAILGHDPREVVGRSFLDFVWPADAALTQSALDTAAGVGDLTRFENRYRHRDGTPRVISWHTSAEGDLVYAYGRDVTLENAQAADLAIAQEALRQSQKMEAVGQLTGGIAHDFNNMLAVVIGSLDLLGRRLGTADARARRHIDAAADAARRAALLTQRLLAFARQQPLRPETLDMNKIVADMSNLLRRSLGGTVRLETVLAGGAWRSRADPNQIENAILNLAVNARDAMPDGGRLTIETQNAHLDARNAAAHRGVPAGQYVLISVTDTGAGMTPDVAAKAFDPFFTTKEVGKGTGLGLSQVYGFAKQSGGHVKIESEPGHGTTVKLYLPRFVGVAGEAEDGAAAEPPLGES